MNKRYFTWLGSLLFVSLMATQATALALPAAGGRAARSYPELDAALAALRSARDHLHAAATAYGGHRGNAERLADQAIVAVRQALSYAGTGRAGNPQAPPLATGQRRPVKGYPEMHSALADLRTARAHLMRGATGFAGHRVTALNLTNRAIDQCLAALRYVHSKP
jgi:hypothetical protein